MVGSFRFAGMETESCLVGDGRRTDIRFNSNTTESENASYSSHINVCCPFTKKLKEYRSGIHEVGILVGILRKLQHWSFSSIVFEYRSFAGPNARFTEEQFIEVFDEKAIVLPSNLPTWWIEQEHLHSTTIEEESHYTPSEVANET